MDMGVGTGEFVPRLALALGTGISATISNMTVNFQLCGSTNSTAWTLYAETGTLTVASTTAGISTTSLAAGTSAFNSSGFLLPLDLVKRPPGAALPRYYSVNIVVGGVTASVLCTGSIIGGIVLTRADWDDTGGKYSAGFTVA